MKETFIYWTPWILLGIILIAIVWALRILLKRSRLKCPQCNKFFGKMSAYLAKPYYPNGILDGPALDLDGIAGQDGFIIHCKHCKIDVYFDNSNKLLGISEGKQTQLSGASTGERS